MGFMDHLMELRRRLWKSAVAVFICMVVALAFYSELWGIVRAPLDNIQAEYDNKLKKAELVTETLKLKKDAPAQDVLDAIGKLGAESSEARTLVFNTLLLKPDADAAVVKLAVEKTIEERDEHVKLLADLRVPPGAGLIEIVNPAPLSTMMMVMWIGVGVGLVLSSPILLYELWAFVSPGLRQKEKNAITPVLMGGVFFFAAGASIAYFILFPFSLNFFVWLDLRLKVRPFYSVDEYSTLLFNMLWMTGLVCEIPLVIAALAKLALVKASTLTNYWRICVLVSFILGSLFSPGSDIMSMLVFSALLLSLYVLSILMAWIFFPKEVLEQERKMEEERKREEEEERRNAK